MTNDEVLAEIEDIRADLLAAQGAQRALIARLARLAASIEKSASHPLDEDLTPIFEQVMRRLDASGNKMLLPSQIGAIRKAMAARRPGRGDLRALVAERVGVSTRTVDKIAAVCAAAERDPGKFGHLVEEMDRRKKVDGVYKKLRLVHSEAAH